MGKKRIIKKSGKGLDQGRKERALSKATKHHLEKGVLDRTVEVHDRPALPRILEAGAP